MLALIFEFAGDFPPQPRPHVLSELDPAREEAAGSAVRGVCGPVRLPGLSCRLL